MINATKLHDELVAAGIPIIGCNSNGEVRFKDEATAAQRTQTATIVAAHDPSDTEDQKVAKLSVLTTPKFQAAQALVARFGYANVPANVKTVFDAGIQAIQDTWK